MVCVQLLGQVQNTKKTQNMINTDHSMVVYLLIIFLFVLVLTSKYSFFVSLSKCQSSSPQLFIHWFTYTLSLYKFI